MRNSLSTFINERNALIQWLRDKGFNHHASNIWDDIADAIERGDHLKMSDDIEDEIGLFLLFASGPGLVFLVLILIAYEIWKHWP